MPAPVDEAPAPRLTLATFEGPGAPSDDAVMPPSKEAQGNAAPADDAPPKSVPQAEPSIKPLVEEPEAKPDPATDDDEDAPPPIKKKDESDTRTLDDAFEDPVGAAKRESAAKAEADKKAAEESAAAEKAKAEGAPPPERDSDLKVEHAAHTHPKTRKIITDFQAKARTARDERDAALAKTAELEKRAAAAEEKAKTVAVPEATEKELKDLRERVRELDISKDPQIQAKYDAKIEANNKSILNVLKAAKFQAFIDDPTAINKLETSGLTSRTLRPFIVALEEADRIEEADALRDAVQENKQIYRNRQAEIDSWKGDYSRREQQRAVAEKQAKEIQDKLYLEQTDLQLNQDLAELEKTFPHLKQPPAPLPTDVPVTQKAKQAAIDEWTAASKAVEAAVKGFSPEGIAPEKMPEVVGRINAAAIQSQVLKHHVLPRLNRELASLTARNKELEAEIGRIKDAGKLSRLQSGAANDPSASGRTEAKSLDEAFVDPTRG